MITFLLIRLLMIVDLSLPSRYLTHVFATYMQQLNASTPLGVRLYISAQKCVSTVETISSHISYYQIIWVSRFQLPRSLPRFTDLIGLGCTLLTLLIWCLLQYQSWSIVVEHYPSLSWVVVSDLLIPSSG